MDKLNDVLVEKQDEVITPLMSSPYSDSSSPRNSPQHKQSHEDINSQLFQAVNTGQTETVMILLNNPNINVNYKSVEGWAPLHVAASKGDSICLKLLIEKGAQINIQNDWVQTTSLHYAASAGYWDCVDILLKAGASASISSLGGDGVAGWTPLHDACYHGHMRVCELLIKHGANINAKNECGDTPLIKAAMNGDISIIKLLMTNGANIHEKNMNKETALYTSCKEGDSEVVEMFLDAGAEVNPKDQVRWSPLAYACGYGHHHTAKLLIERGANVDFVCKGNRTALICAAENIHIDCSEVLLINKANVNFQTPSTGIAALHIATLNGNSTFVETLLSFGAHINIQSKFQANAIYGTPLHLAAGHNKFLCVKKLVEKGANIDTVNEENHTAIYIATKHGHIEIVRYLLTRGANIKLATKEKDTLIVYPSPLDVATSDEIRHLLQHKSRISYCDFGCL